MELAALFWVGDDERRRNIHPLILRSSPFVQRACLGLFFGAKRSKPVIGWSGQSGGRLAKRNQFHANILRVSFRREKSRNSVLQRFKSLSIAFLMRFPVQHTHLFHDCFVTNMPRNVEINRNGKYVLYNPAPTRSIFIARMTEHKIASEYFKQMSK